MDEIACKKVQTGSSYGQTIVLKGDAVALAQEQMHFQVFLLFGRH